MEAKKEVLKKELESNLTKINDKTTSAEDLKKLKAERVKKLKEYAKCQPSKSHIKLHKSNPLRFTMIIISQTKEVVNRVLSKSLQITKNKLPRNCNGIVIS